MVLADSSVWISHFRGLDPRLLTLLRRREVLVHPFVLGKLAMGNLAPRQAILADLSDLPGAAVATDAEVLSLVEAHRLYGLGIGYIDAHLLAAVRLTSGAMLWTFDKRLGAAAERLHLAWEN